MSADYKGFRKTRVAIIEALDTLDNEAELNTELKLKIAQKIKALLVEGKADIDRLLEEGLPVQMDLGLGESNK